jgi:hypothetical protein
VPCPWWKVTACGESDAAEELLRVVHVTARQESIYIKYIATAQGSTMMFDIGRNDSSPTWALRNQPTPT